MAKFNFYLKDKYASSETPIILYIRYEGKRLRYYTGKSILPKFWSEKEQAARKVNAFPQHSSFNNSLEVFKKVSKKAFDELHAELERLPSTKEIKTRLDGELKEIPEENPEEASQSNFLQLFKRFIQESKDGNRLTSSGKRFDKRSIQKYNTVYKVLEQFGETYNLTFETINQDFYKKFIHYLNKPIYGKDSRGKKVQVKKSFSLNNVGKYVQVLKTFLIYATENGYNTNMFFQSKQFKAHKVPGFSIYLNEDEIRGLYDLDLTNARHLERVRDLFIVGCWTGLRFSDFTAIKPENVDGDFIRIKTFKTNENVIIPIHSMVRSILAKYDGKYPNNLPPAIANQKMNAHLKEIAKQVESLQVPVEVDGIRGGLKIAETKQKWELVTTHTARRSFATNVYKSGFPAISLMKITGHRTEKSFLLYIKVTPEENAKKLLDHWNNSSLKVS